MTKIDRGGSHTSDASEDESLLLDGGVGRKLPVSQGMAAAPPLTLPREGEGAAPAQAAPRVSSHKPAQPDAWTVDRLRRSSLPPAMAERAGSAVPPSPRVPLSKDVTDAGDDGGALSLVGRARVAASHPADLVDEMSDSFALGDYTGALRAAVLLLGREPGHDLALHYERESREKLEGIYLSRLYSPSSVFELAVRESELRWLGLDPCAEMVLSRVDGMATVEAIVAGCTVPRLESLRSLAGLLAARVIRLV